MLALRWMVSVIALLVLIGCADARRPEKVNLIIEAYESYGYEYVGQDEDEYIFLDRVERRSHGRFTYYYLAVLKEEPSETNAFSQSWPWEA